MPAVTICNQNSVSCTNLKIVVEACTKDISACANNSQVLNYTNYINDRFCVDTSTSSESGIF